MQPVEQHTHVARAKAAGRHKPPRRRIQLFVQRLRPGQLFSVTLHEQLRRVLSVLCLQLRRKALHKLRYKLCPNAALAQLGLQVLPAIAALRQPALVHARRIALVVHQAVMLQLLQRLLALLRICALLLQTLQHFFLAVISIGKQIQRTIVSLLCAAKLLFFLRARP